MAAAILAAVPGDVILVEEGTTLYENGLLFNKDLTIRSGTSNCNGASHPSATPPIIDGMASGRVARVTADVTFRQITLRNGYTQNTGGAGLKVESGGNATLIDATVALNVAEDTVNPIGPAIGGGIHVDSGGTLTLQGDSSVLGNQLANTVYAWGAGGIYLAPGATAILEDDSLIGIPVVLPNLGAAATPGGVLVEGVLDMHDNSTVSGNIAGNNSAGGGIFVFGSGAARLYDSSRVSANSSAPLDGGGVHLNGGSLLAVGAPTVVIDGNTAGGGGGIEVWGGGSVDLTNVDVHSNVADFDGAGIRVSDGDLTLTDVTVSGNFAGANGGGLYLNGAGVFANLENTTVHDNDAAADGGGIFVGGATTTLWAQGGFISENQADRGGGIFVDAGDVDIDLFDLTGNDAHTEGGALRQRGESTVRLWRGQVEGNEAGTIGGAFAISGGETDLWLLDVVGNSAGTDGGGMAVAFQGDVWTRESWYHDNDAVARGGAIAVLSSGPNTNPLLTMVGATQEACGRTLGVDEYCSEVRGNTALTGGGGIFMEDGTAAVISTALIGNDAGTQGSAIGLLAHPTSNGVPVMTAWNVLSVGNGASAGVDVVRIQEGLFNAEHVTSADNVGVPFRFLPGAAGSRVRRSILWDPTLVQIDSSITLDAVCTMFRAVPVGGATTGALRDFGLDPSFVTTARGDYRLDATISIHAVDQCNLGLTHDIDGDPRAFKFDRGAFEAP